MKHIGTVYRPSGLEGRTLSRRPSSKIKAVVLAGGLGTRLRPYTLFLPKPMLPVGHSPILEHIVEWLKSNGIKDIVISTGYLGKMIENHFGDGASWGVKIQYARSSRALGIAGQLRNAAPLLPERFVCLYGDAILNFNLKDMIKSHEENHALLTMALMKYVLQVKYGVIETKDDGRISAWREKPAIEREINVGCYVMEKKYLSYIGKGAVAGMKEAFDEALKNREPLYGFRVQGEFWDIGDKQAYAEADNHFQKLYGGAP